jgi:hypothetical protein
MEVGSYFGEIEIFSKTSRYFDVICSTNVCQFYYITIDVWYYIKVFES